MVSGKPDHPLPVARLSLRPLSLEEALKAALEVEPPEKPVRKGRVKKAKPPNHDGSLEKP